MNPLPISVHRVLTRWLYGCVGYVFAYVAFNGWYYKGGPIPLWYEFPTWAFFAGVLLVCFVLGPILFVPKSPDDSFVRSLWTSWGSLLRYAVRVTHEWSVKRVQGQRGFPVVFENEFSDDDR